MSFEEASEVFGDDVDALEIFDEQHSDVEDRFISIGAYQARSGARRLDRTRRRHHQNHFGTLGDDSRESALPRIHLGKTMNDDIPELSDADFESAIPARVRKRLIQGKFESGDDIAALRKFVRLTQSQFAQAMGISVHTLRNWEQGRRTPEGPAIALLRIAAKHPRIIRENLKTAE